MSIAGFRGSGLAAIRRPNVLRLIWLLFPFAAACLSSCQSPADVSSESQEVSSDSEGISADSGLGIDVSSVKKSADRVLLAGEGSGPPGREVLPGEGGGEGDGAQVDIELATRRERMAIDDAFITEEDLKILNDEFGRPSLVGTHKILKTTVVRSGPGPRPALKPMGFSRSLNVVRYASELGPLVAYVSKDPGDGKRHPAIIWITGEDNNSIGDVWTPRDRSNDQSARQFRQAGVVMMYPSQRGGNDNPGMREGFYGEVLDIVAATKYLASLPYVDADRLYLGGHHTGATLAMLVAAYSSVYKAVFACGPVSYVNHYNGRYVYCDPESKKEMLLRSPYMWQAMIESKTFVFEGAAAADRDKNIDFLKSRNVGHYHNVHVQHFVIPGHDANSYLVGLNELLARMIVNGNVSLDADMLKALY